MPTRFDTYSQYANSLISEKLTIVHLHAFQQVFNFTLDSGNIYYKNIDQFVTSVKRLGSSLVRVASKAALINENLFYYAPKEKRVYLYSSDGDLADEQVILGVRFFFSNLPINMAWDLTDNNSSEVEYLPRIVKAPGFKSEIGTDQQGISITGSGRLEIENSDGFFDDVYDTYFFEQKLVEVYSYHRDLDPTEAKIIYRGFITEKYFTDRIISFKIDDTMFKLDQKVPLNALQASDGVSEAFEGEFKRRIYGKLEGLLLRSIDQIGQGYTLTGTVTNALIGSTTLIGSGTLFLDEVSPEDKLTIDGIDYDVETVNSNTSITISDSDGLQTAFESISITNVPERPWRKKNRQFLIAGHALKQASTTITASKELNRFTVADITGIEANDILQVGAEAAIVKRISGNQITTRFNLSGLKSVGTSVVKEPVQKLFIEGEQITLSDIDTISNTSTQADVTISNLSEFNITPNKSLPSFISFTWTASSRTITTAANVDLTTYLQPRDWIRRSLEADTTFLEVLEVSTNTIKTRTAYAGSSGSAGAVIRLPNLISDESNVSADVLGRTKDNTAFGELIETGPEVIFDLLDESDLSQYVDTASFQAASIDAPYRVSIKLPFNITDKTAPTVRDVINDINMSIFGSLVLNNGLNMAYNILDAGLPSLDLPVISEDDTIKYTIKGRSSRLYKAAQTLYSFRDFDKNIKADTGKSLDFTSSFVESFETSNKTADLRLNVFDLNSAQILTERFVFFNSLSEAVIDIETSLNLSYLSMGDQVILKFDRLYKRLGDFDSRFKVGTVIGINRTGDNVKLTISDLGNIYNRAAIISDDNADDYVDSDESELLISSHITDENGLVDDEEKTTQTNLIT